MHDVILLNLLNDFRDPGMNYPAAQKFSEIKDLFRNKVENETTVNFKMDEHPDRLIRVHSN